MSQMMQYQVLKSSLKPVVKFLMFRPTHFGDVIFGFPCLHDLHLHFHGNIEIDWVVDHSYVEFMKAHPLIHQVYGMRMLGKETERVPPVIDYNQYDYIYDAQNDPWSRPLLSGYRGGHLIRRPRYRWNRFWMQKTNVKFMQRPQVGMLSYRRPLAKALKYDLPETYEPKMDFSNLSFMHRPESLVHQMPEKFIGLITGASMPLKKWPVENWQKLIIDLIAQYKMPVVGIGGPDDRLNGFEHPSFIDLAGCLNWEESAYLVSRSWAFVGGDTGLTHLADYFKIPSVHLRGASTFGFPNNPSTKLMYKNLKCQPCSKNGRGICKNKEELLCLKSISPMEVRDALAEMMAHYSKGKTL